MSNNTNTSALQNSRLYDTNTASTFKNSVLGANSLLKQKNANFPFSSISSNEHNNSTSGETQKSLIENSKGRPSLRQGGGSGGGSGSSNYGKKKPLQVSSTPAAQVETQHFSSQGSVQYSRRMIASRNANDPITDDSNTRRSN